MKIKRISVVIENDRGEESQQFIAFDVFIAHVQAASSASSYWPVDVCDKLKELGAKESNYRKEEIND